MSGEEPYPNRYLLPSAKETASGRGRTSLQVLFSFEIFSPKSLRKKSAKIEPMSNPDSLPNHIIDPETGFLENPGYISAFDAQRKILFLQRLKANGLRLYRTADEMGLSRSTIEKHYKHDPAFKKAYDALEREYADELEGVSRLNALNPRSVIERIFQLKSLLPNKYGDQKNNGGSTVINFNLDGKMLDNFKVSSNIVEAEIVPPPGNGESCAA